ncbi:MAG: flippase [Nitrospinae bacterium]|nr:flippase [Nitrospinota bacterium]
MMKDDETKIYLQDIVRIAKGAWINFCGTLLGRGLGILFTLLISRTLIVNEVGIYYLAITIINLAVMISLLGLDSGILRYISIFSGKKDIRRVKGTIISSLWIAIPMSIIIAILLFLSSRHISLLFNKPELVMVLKVFSLTIPFFVITHIFIKVTHSLRLMHFNLYVRDLGEQILKILLAAIFLYMGWRILGVILSNIITIILIMGISLYLMNRLIPLTDKNDRPILEFKQLTRFSFPQLFSTFSLFLIMWTDTLMLGYFSDSGNVGIYNVTTRIAILGSLILSSFNTIFSPMISDLHNREMMHQLEGLFQTVTKWIFTLSFPLFLIFIFFAKPILAIFGTEFIVGYSCLIILSIGQLINSITGPSGLVLLMSGRSYISLFNDLSVCILNIILNYQLIPRYGLLGAAIATTLSITIVNLLRLIEVFYIWKIHPYSVSYLKPLFAGLIGVSIISIINKIPFFVDNIWSLFIFISLFLVIYLSLLCLFGLDKRDSYILKIVGNRLCHTILTKSGQIIRSY